MTGDSETRKWILKQGEYRRLYSSLLRKHRGALQGNEDGTETAAAPSGGSENSEDSFADESAILTGILRTEASNIALGIGAAAAALGSLRFIKSRHAMSSVFGRAKAEAMTIAEAEGKKMGTDSFQKTFANVVEGLFSVWLGYRCYDYLSHSPSTTTNSDTAPDSVDAIAALPLCRGRSKIAEALCPDWIDVTQHQIPKAYWKALDDGRLRDERTWRAIQRFSVNCERRKAAEVALRSQLSLKMDEPVALPTRLDDGGKHP